MPRHPLKAERQSVVASEYEIRVRGRVGKSLLSGFDGFDAEVEPAETILRGAISDQAALHGVLDRIQGLGLELVEVRRLDRNRRSRAPDDGSSG
jgi:hypothetical protein